MTQLLEALVRQASSEASSTQDEAILRLAMLLEYNRFLPEHRAAKRSHYEELVPADVLVDIDEIAEKEVLAAVGAIARSARFKASILWAIGKAKPHLACPELVGIIEERSRTFDSEATWQAVAALDNCYAPRNATVERSLRSESLRRFLEKTAGSDNSHARDVAAKLIQRIGQDLGS